MNGRVEKINDSCIRYEKRRSIISETERITETMPDHIKPGVNLSKFKQGEIELDPIVHSNTAFIKELRAGVYNMARKKKSLHTGALLVLLYLVQHQNWKDKKDKHNTYSYWGQTEHLIVSSRSVHQMAADLGVHRATIYRRLKHLEEDGMLGIVSAGNGESIYILGMLGEDKDGNETREYFFTGEISLV